MSDKLDDQILGRLGDQQVSEIATLLGTDRDTALATVRTALPSIMDGLTAEAEAAAHQPQSTLKGVATVAGGGLLGGAILSRVLDPAARALSKKTGIPHHQVRSVLTILAPIALSAISAQIKKRKQTHHDYNADWNRRHS